MVLARSNQKSGFYYYYYAAYFSLSRLIEMLRLSRELNSIELPFKVMMMIVIVIMMN